MKKQLKLLENKIKCYNINSYERINISNKFLKWISIELIYTSSLCKKINFAKRMRVKTFIFG